MRRSTVLVFALLVQMVSSQQSTSTVKTSTATATVSSSAKATSTTPLTTSTAKLITSTTTTTPTATTTTTTTTTPLTTSTPKPTTQPPTTTAVSCASGMFRNASSNTCVQCSVCGAGQFASTVCGSTNNTVCRACRAGYACPSQSVETACGIGLYSAATSTVCSSCGVNSFSDVSTASVCKQCPANSASAIVGSVSIMQCNCNDGFYRDAQYSCVACPVGSMCSANVITACPPGRFANATALSVCTACDFGTYQPLLGASACLTCPAGLTVMQTTTSTEFASPTLRSKTLSGTGHVYVMRNYFILAQGDNLTKWSFYSIKSNCAVTPAIFRSDVNGNTFDGSAWFTLWKKGTRRVTSGQGLHTFNFIDNENYSVRNAVSTGIPYVNSYEFFGWIFDSDVCIPYETGTATSASYVMEFNYNPSSSVYLKTSTGLPPSQIWSVQVSYEWGNVVPSTTATGSSSALQCMCPSGKRQISDGSCQSLCDPGMYTAPDGSCAVCSQGSYCVQSASTPCPLGQSSAPGSSSCAPCGGSSDIQLYLCGLLTACAAATPVQLPGSFWFGLGNVTIGTDSQGLTPSTPWFSGSVVAGMVLNAASDRPYALLQQTVTLPSSSPVAFRFKIMCTGVACSQVQLRVQWSNDLVLFSPLMDTISVSPQWVTVSLPYVSPSGQQISIRIISQLNSLSSIVWVSGIQIMTLGRWGVVGDPSSIQLLNDTVDLPVLRSPVLSTVQSKAVVSMATSSLVWTVSGDDLIQPPYQYYATVSAVGSGTLTVSTSASDSRSWALTSGVAFNQFMFNPTVTPSFFSIQTVGNITVGNPRLTLQSPYTECQACLTDHWCTNQLIFACPSHSAAPLLSTRQTDCWCVAGYYGKNNSLVGYTPCTLCPVNYYCPGGNTVSVCPPGTKADSGSSVCSQCPADQFCQDGQVGTCPLHSHSPAGSNELSDCICDDGYYGSAPNCALCEVGSYCMGGIKTQCAANAISIIGAPDPTACFCDRGYYGIGSQSCAACEEGAWCWTGVRNLCAANMWSPAKSNVPGNCTCTYGYQRSSTMACVPCGTGTFKPTRSDNVCTSCNPGTYSTALAATALSTCAQCAVGTFNNQWGQYQCQACAAGYYASGLGNTACGTCWAGSYSAVAAGVCTSCGAGTMSAAVAATSVAVCQACVPGSWSSGNTSSCSICGACPYWSYPPTVFFNVLSLQPVAVGITDNVNFAVLSNGNVLMSQLAVLWYVDLSAGVATFKSVTVPGAGGVFASLASSTVPGYAYAVQGMYVFRIDLQRASWDVVYPSTLATCVLEDGNLVWVVQGDSVRALDRVSTAVVRSFPQQGSHHICIHPLYPTSAFVTGSFGLKRVNRVSGDESVLLTNLAYTVCTFTPDGNFLVLSQPDTRTAWAYSVSDGKLTKVLNNAVLTDIYADNTTIVFASQNAGIQNVSYSFSDSRTCGPGKFSLYSGLQLESQCQVCPAGSLCPGGANITQCAPGTYSLVTGSREQGQCLTCPSGYSCAGGNDLTVCSLGSYSPYTGLIQLSDCPLCDAGYFCPNSTTRIACPPNTMSVSGASDLGDCQCNAGYKCVYVRVVHAAITLPMSLAQFTDEMRSRYILAIALAAEVDISNVQIVAVQQVTLTGGRRLLEHGSEAVEIHTSVYNAPQDAKIGDLDKHLLGLGLPSHRGFQMSIHMEVVDSIAL